MEKVKLTREQANAIEYALQEVDEYKGNPDKLLRHASMKNVYFRNELHLLNSIDTVNLAKALYIGYEVEPEFKKGDYVMVKWKNREKEEFYRVVSIDPWGSIQIETLDGSPNSSGHENTRHATPEEIAEEKERRWWAKHGREVWALKKGDVVQDVTDGYTATVESIYETYVEFSDAVQYVLDSIKKHCRIVCFSEDRKDI